MATAKSATATAANPANDTVSAREIEENIERIRGDIASLAGTLKKYGSGKTDEYKAKAAAAGEDLTKLSQNALNDLSAELQTYERAFVAEVRRRPLQSIGIAAGIGFLIAALVRR
ncbi:ElaB/YgaM/YqjD family protein [Roseibium sp. LAB1]